MRVSFSYFRSAYYSLIAIELFLIAANYENDSQCKLTLFLFRLIARSKGLNINRCQLENEITNVYWRAWFRNYHTFETTEDNSFHWLVSLQFLFWILNFHYSHLIQLYNCNIFILFLSSSLDFGQAINKWSSCNIVIAVTCRSGIDSRFSVSVFFLLFASFASFLCSLSESIWGKSTCRARCDVC